MSTTALMTFAEFEQLPDCPGKQELIDGEVIQLPPPVAIHTLIAKWCRRCRPHIPNLYLLNASPGRQSGSLSAFAISIPSSIPNSPACCRAVKSQSAWKSSDG